MLEGQIIMQLKGQPAVTVKAGQTFYEGPTDVHVVGRNASNTEEAREISSASAPSRPACWRAFPMSAIPAIASSCCRACAWQWGDDMSQTRRLAAILAADAAGYSRLMGVTRGRGRHTLECLRA